MDKQPIHSEESAQAKSPPQSSPSPTTVSISPHDDADITSQDAMTSATDATEEYPHGARLAAIVFSLMLAMFLVALDNVSPPLRDAPTPQLINPQSFHQTILGTAIPKITDEFHDLNKVSWYGSAYLMTFGGG